MRDTLQVLTAGAVSTTVTLTNIDLIIKICVGLATLGFIAYKWYRTYKQK